MLQIEPREPKTESQIPEIESHFWCKTRWIIGQKCQNGTRYAGAF